MKLAIHILLLSLFSFSAWALPSGSCTGRISEGGSEVELVFSAHDEVFGVTSRYKAEFELRDSEGTGSSSRAEVNVSAIQSGPSQYNYRELSLKFKDSSGKALNSAATRFEKSLSNGLANIILEGEVDGDDFRIECHIRRSSIIFSL